MFVATIKDQYGDYEFFHAPTKVELDKEVENWIKDNVDLDTKVEVCHFSLDSKQSVSYEIVYQNLLTTKAKPAKATPEI